LNIFLAGGGSPEQSIALDKLYFGSINSESNITYVPVALRGKRSFAECGLWFEDLASKYGNFNLSILEDLNNQENQLQESDAIFIGGGNTYSLLHEVNRSGFADLLVQFAHTGKPIYGGSAGAVILGKDIETIKFMDENKYNTRDTSALNLVSGYSVYPHYDESADEQILKYVAETSIPVLAISEDAGVWVKSVLEPVGSVWLFDINGKNKCA